MLAVKGVFDGKSIKLTDKEIPSQPQDVIVTFLGSDQEEIQQDIYSLANQGKSFDFLSHEEEIYSDEDLKVRY